jgi:hypothetical protein
MQCNVFKHTNVLWACLLVLQVLLLVSLLADATASQTQDMTMHCFPAHTAPNMSAAAAAAAAVRLCLLLCSQLRAGTGWK